MIDYVDTVKEEWLYEKEMEKVIGLIFQVRNVLGAGRSEEIYHQALVNFAHSKVGIRRMIFEERPVEFEEKYARMIPYINEADKAILRQVLTHIKRIARQYGLGYPESLYRKLIAAELAYQGISCTSDIRVPATYEGEKIGTQATPFILIENRFLLHVRALIEGTTTHDFLTTRTFLAELGLKIGWVVNFGRSKVYIQATAVRM